MIGTIRKHQKWLWIAVVFLTIVSFVIFFSPYRWGRHAPGEQPPELGSIAGKRVTPEQFASALNEVRLHYFLTRGDWPDRDQLVQQTGFDEQRETYHRLLLLQKARQLGIRASSDSVARLAADVLRSFRRGAPVSLALFEREVLNPRGLTREDFARALRHELELQQLVNLTGLAGMLITPEEAKAIYRHENQELSAALVVFPATNYLQRVEVAPDQLTQFYSNNLARYEIPERVQVRYVRWELTNFLAEADADLAGLTNAVALVRFGLIQGTPQAMAQFTNLDAVVEAIYQQRGTNFFGADTTPEDARQQIKNELRNAAALRAARRQAVEFANVLFDTEPLRAANLDKLAAQSNLTVHVTASFDRDNPPEGLEVGRAFINAAFALSDEDPLKGPLVGEDGVYVVALEKRFPAEIPPFETVREFVTRDFMYQKALALAHEHGTEFYRTLTNSLTQGKTFVAVCRDAGLKPIFPQPFSRRTRTLAEVEDLVPLGLLKEVAFRLALGEASQFVPTHLGGFIVRAQSRLPVDEKQMEADLPTFISLLRQTALNEAFSAWLRAEAELALRNTPLARRERLPESNAGTGQ